MEGNDFLKSFDQVGVFFRFVEEYEQRHTFLRQLFGIFERDFSHEWDALVVGPVSQVGERDGSIVRHVGFFRFG